ncbi:hypothetical protein PTNB85_04901 [Pyrenophora teres f. teres]|uniref:Uncharacterized protein n=1 Tax=Pyrenophora teres f. teres TaxID=97479 RepID=A0A6S6VPM5_9PLEO|nr:hypothetical protein PTNB85_04901 [Pyrenophora teres f. teres]CAE6996264.1 hypothetical protein PTTW11_00309 [Pyrenophora teres f. teres]
MVSKKGASKKPTKEQQEEDAKKKREGIGYPTWHAGGKLGKISLDILINRLHKRQRQHDAVAARLPALIREHIRLREAGNEQALTTFEQTRGSSATAYERRNVHNDLAADQSLLEDFLYYQIAEHRRSRLRVLRDGITGNDAKGKPRGNAKFPHDSPETFRRGMLNYYDQRRIGGPEHRSGLTNWVGNVVETPSTDPRRHLVRPNELHLWTPAYRRRPVGLGVTPEENETIVANEPTLDEEAIARRWEEIETRNIPDEGVTYNTHMERREAERERYHVEGNGGFTRPTTSTILVRDGPNGEETVDSFRKIQTREGIFISARESSYDWRTSYDSLGPVKSGFHSQFTLSEERETIDEPPEEGHSTLRDPIEFDQRYRLLEAKAPVETPAGTKIAGLLPKANNGKGKAGENNQGQKRGRAEDKKDIQYPYGVKDLQDIDGEPKRTKLRNEFLVGHHPLVATDWCEETDGRREWHVNLAYSPASSVDSPPHVPINRNDIDPNTIPPEFPDSNLDVIASSKRRCRHKPDRCRAWWMHAPDECWVVQSEQVPRTASPDPILRPFGHIAPPPDFGLPNSSRNIYQERIGDHYGIMGKGPAHWPRVGVRIPYEPMTYDDLKPDFENDGQGEHIDENAAGSSAPQEPADLSDGSDDNDNSNPKLPMIRVPEGENRNAFEVHSLAAPLIAMSPGRSYGPIDNDPSTSTDIDSDSSSNSNSNFNSNLNVDSNSDSDDDGDLFFESYQEGSVVPPPPDTETSDSSDTETSDSSTTEASGSITIEETPSPYYA